jgi:hypothetical protein
MKKYLCYSCHNIVEFEDLCAECMCINEGHPEYRGVCNNCEHVQFSDYKTKPSDDHNLQKIRKMPKENEEWIKTFFEYVGQYLAGMHNDMYLLYIPIEEYENFINKKGLLDHIDIISKKPTDSKLAFFIDVKYLIPKPSEDVFHDYAYY